MRVRAKVTVIEGGQGQASYVHQVGDVFSVEDHVGVAMLKAGEVERVAERPETTVMPVRGERAVRAR